MPNENISQLFGPSVRKNIFNHKLPFHLRQIREILINIPRSSFQFVLTRRRDVFNLLANNTRLHKIVYIDCIQDCIFVSERKRSIDILFSKQARPCGETLILI